MTISRTTAYVIIAATLLAEVLFIGAWVTDQRNQSAIRLAAVVWPLLVLAIADAIRSSSPLGQMQRLGREMLRKRWSAEHGNGNSGDHGERADEMDAKFGVLFLFVAPVLAVGLGVYLWIA